MFLFVLSLLLVNSAVFAQEGGSAQTQSVNALDFLKTTAGSDGAGYNTGFVTGDVAPQFAIAMLVGTYVFYFVSFLGIIFLVLIIYAGWLWLTAGGNDEQITKAKALMKNAVIGFVVVLAADLTWELLRFLAFIRN